MVSPRLTVRPANQDALRALQASGIHPLARLWARGVTHPDQTKLAWPAPLPPAGLTHSAHAAGVLADAIQAGRRLLIVADYDCDGATACAVGCARCRPWARTWTSWCPTASRPATACRLPWSTWP